MWVMTFHSACVRILRGEAAKVGMRSTFSIYDAADSQRLMSLVIRDLDLDPKRYAPRSFSAQVSNLKNELIDEETYARRVSEGNHHERTLSAAYTRYPAAAPPGQRARLRRHHHDDRQLLMPSTGRRGVLSTATSTSSSTSTRTRTWPSTSSSRSVGQGVPPPPGHTPGSCVVGDPDQSIYAWRSAAIRNILNFEQRLPQARRS